ncbi:glycosyltransferase family 4 protein [Candidatus Peregrinibacteria bacterium]|nr:glycosyltransferase family 4 protein [Candidatus Peregrinibacteria bacterium]
MRIGIDARMYAGDFTGIGRYTYELIRHLPTLKDSNEYVVFLRAREYEHFQPASPRITKVLADYRHYSFGEQIGFLRVLNRANLDLMHFTHFNAPIFYRRPYVVTIHDLTLSFFPGKKMTRLFHRLAYQFALRNVVFHARAIIAVSKNTQKDLERLVHVPASKIQVIYHGIDPSFGQVTPSSINDVKQRYGLLTPYFLYTGVWRDHKNVVGMIKAFDLFLKNSPEGAETFPGLLVMTGKEDPFYPEVKQTIQTLGLENRVRLVGLVPEEDLKALYQGAFAYISPSFYEGFGFSPLEAMQSGIPVLASATSSIPEVCGADNALYFDPHDVPAIAQRMKEITTDPTLRYTLIERGKRHVQPFRWESMARATFAFYSKACP